MWGDLLTLVLGLPKIPHCQRSTATTRRHQAKSVMASLHLVVFCICNLFLQPVGHAALIIPATFWTHGWTDVTESSVISVARQRIFPMHLFSPTPFRSSFQSKYSLQNNLNDVIVFSLKRLKKKAIRLNIFWTWQLTWVQWHQNIWYDCATQNVLIKMTLWFEQHHFHTC